MNRRFLVIVALIVIVMSGTFVSASLKGERKLDALTGTPAKIGFIGDSITAGAHATAANAVQSEMNSLGSGYGDVNRGMGGATTADWLPGGIYYDSSLAVFKSEDVHIVSIMLGVNDALLNATTPEQYGDNMRTIADKLLGSGQVKYVIINYPTYIAATDKNGITAEGIDKVRSSLQQYMRQLDRLVNGKTIIKGDTAAYGYFAHHESELVDGVHPTDAGYKQLGILWAKAVKNFLTTHHI